MMVATCSNYSVKMDCPESAFHLDSSLTTKITETGMNNFSYEGLAREFCVHGMSSMCGFLMSAGMLPFLDDLEEAIREAKNGGVGQ